MRREFLPRTEPYHQSKLYAKCQSSLTIVVLTEMQMRFCIIKLGVVSSIYGYFGEETGLRCTYVQSLPDWVLQREFCAGSGVRMAL